MFDKPSVFTISIDLVIWLLMLICMWPVLTKKEKLRPKRLVLSISLVVLFCVMATWSGDWYNYKEIFDSFQVNPDRTSHMEEIYDFLIRSVCPTYLSFRLLVWGAALGLFYLAVKRLGLSQSYVWCIFALGFLPFFSYARVSIVPAMLLLGGSLVFAPISHHRILSISLGFIIILLSLFFHKTAFYGVIIMLFCFLVPQTTKNSWFYFLLGFIVASFTLQYVFQYFLSTDLVYDPAISSFAEKTRGTASVGFYSNLSIGPLITRLAEQIPYFMTAILAFKIQNGYQTPRGIMTIIKFNFYMVLFSMIFLFDLGSSTSVLYGRFLRFSILSGVVTLAYAYQYGLFKKLTRATIVLAVAGSGYQIVYEIYCKFVGI